MDLEAALSSGRAASAEAAEVAEWLLHLPLTRPVGEVEARAERSDDFPDLGSPRRTRFLVEIALELLTLFKMLDQRPCCDCASFDCDASAVLFRGAWPVCVVDCEGLTGESA